MVLTHTFYSISPVLFLIKVTKLWWNLLNSIGIPIQKAFRDKKCLLVDSGSKSCFWIRDFVVIFSISALYQQNTIMVPIKNSCLWPRIVTTEMHTNRYWVQSLFWDQEFYGLLFLDQGFLEYGDWVTLAKDHVAFIQDWNSPVNCIWCRSVHNLLGYECVLWIRDFTITVFWIRDFWNMVTE